MIFSSLIQQHLQRIFNFALLGGLVLLVACTDEQESDPLRQHAQAHEFNIVAIEIDTGDMSILQTESNLSLKVYGLLENGSRLQTEPDSQDNTVDRNISSLVSWSVSDPTLGSVTQSGVFQSLKVNGGALITASFSGYHDSVEIYVTDAELAEIIIEGEIEVDVCRDIELTAKGILEDGNQVQLDTTNLTWSVNNVSAGSVLAKFKDESVATLSTYLTGEVVITAQDKSTDVQSSEFNLSINDNLLDIAITNENNTATTPGAEVTYTATGEYIDGSYDITANTSFTSNDSSIATFTDNLLTIGSNDTAGKSVVVKGSCNQVEKELTVNITAAL